MTRKDRNEKTVSVRMPEILIEHLQALAYVDGETVGAEIRMAVEERIKSVREDPRFLERLEAAKQRQIDSLSRLAMA